MCFLHIAEKVLEKASLVGRIVLIGGSLDTSNCLIAETTITRFAATCLSMRYSWTQPRHRRLALTLSSMSSVFSPQHVGGQRLMIGMHFFGILNPQRNFSVLSVIFDTFRRSLNRSSPFASNGGKQINC